ncbi:hypothetical protein B0H14DRAFT_2880445 [Mycena olivaceomarginata]|nr:hypothetical protein B0H14DRAFT_2880445 [Mycena olivaceomarginata]
MKRGETPADPPRRSLLGPPRGATAHRRSPLTRGRPQYYLGQVPRTDDLITPALIPETIKRRKLSVHLASDWHTSSIRLAGRIFGSVQRTMAARMAGTTS